MYSYTPPFIPTHFRKSKRTVTDSDSIRYRLAQAHSHSIPFMTIMPKCLPWAMCFLHPMKQTGVSIQFGRDYSQRTPLRCFKVASSSPFFLCSLPSKNEYPSYSLGPEDRLAANASTVSFLLSLFLSSFVPPFLPSFFLSKLLARLDHSSGYLSAAGRTQGTIFLFSPKHLFTQRTTQHCFFHLLRSRSWARSSR